jgi:predicted RNA-binding Zn ribbon-like protein
MKRIWREDDEVSRGVHVASEEAESHELVTAKTSTAESEEAAIAIRNSPFVERILRRT